LVYYLGNYETIKEFIVFHRLTRTFNGHVENLRKRNKMRGQFVPETLKSLCADKNRLLREGKIKEKLIELRNYLGQQVREIKKKIEDF